MDQTLEERVARLEIRAQLENLVGTYSHLYLAGEGDRIVRELWADRPDSSIEIGASGLYAEYGHLATFYQKDHLPGKFTLILPTTPVIQVAADGGSARGIWLGIGTETDAGELGPDYQAGSDPEREMLFSSKDPEGKRYTAEWMFQKLAFDFLLEDGIWKILHLHIYEITRCPYDRDWVRFATERFRTDGMRLDAMFKSNLPFPEEKPPENLASAPTAYHWQYTLDGYTEPIPPMPEPYDTLADLPPI